MKFIACIVATVAVAHGLTSSEEMLDHLDKLQAVSPRFSELKAATQLALGATGRSPMAEVAAMTDMMLIQTEHELTTLQVTHTKYQGQCKSNREKWSKTISAKKTTQDNRFKEADDYHGKWNALLPKLPELDNKMSRTARSISNEENRMQAAIAKRKKEHLAFLQAMNEHDKALEDVRKIRLILQNSKLDDKSNTAATVAAGQKTAEAPKVTKLLDMKDETDPRLHNLLELGHKAMQEEGGSAMDTIYALIYKTRDALLQSRSKLVKEENSANGNWRTNKIAHRNDINDLKILKNTYYRTSGVVRNQIGNYKFLEGLRKISMAEAVKVKEDHQIMKNFLIVACNEDQRVYSRNFAAKMNEKKALQAVQKKLTELKWSNKVYAAVDTVTAGITYLKGEYNFQSNLGRYMAVEGTKVTCTPSAKVQNAGKFNVALQSDDLSYLIFTKDDKGKKMYLTEDESNKVYMRFNPNKQSRWDFKFDKESMSFQINNKVSNFNLYVSQSNGYAVSTLKQVNDARSQFKIEKPNYVEIGCFKNKINKNLADYKGAFNDMNTDKCAALCPAEQYKYFGLAEGKQCFCGGDFNREKAPYSDCGYICPGRGGDSCGGKMRSIIYQNVVVKPIVRQARRGITQSAGGSKCAREHERKGGNVCQCKGVVSYGANGKFYQRRVTGQITCANGAFGDPIHGVVKDCFCKGD